MKETVKKEINETFNELDNILFSFTDEQLNTVPFEGSWTAGQVAEHIIKALKGSSRLLNGPTEDVVRKPDEKIKATRDLFLNFDIKMTSPDFILPDNGTYTKDELLSSINQLKKEMLENTEMDLSKQCTGFELPTFGKFTRLEWLNFYIVHTQRHTHQVKNIFRTLK